MSHLKSYLAFTAAYEVAHKLFVLPYVKIRDYGKEEGHGLLLTEAAAVIGTSAVYSPVIGPVHMLDDLVRLEVRARGLDRSVYDSALVTKEGIIELRHWSSCWIL